MFAPKQAVHESRSCKIPNSVVTVTMYPTSQLMESHALPAHILLDKRTPVVNTNICIKVSKKMILFTYDS